MNKTSKVYVFIDLRSYVEKWTISTGLKWSIRGYSVRDGVGRKEGRES